MDVLEVISRIPVVLVLLVTLVVLKIAHYKTLLLVLQATESKLTESALDADLNGTAKSALLSKLVLNVKLDLM